MKNLLVLKDKVLVTDLSRGEKLTTVGESADILAVCRMLLVYVIDTSLQRAVQDEYHGLVRKHGGVVAAAEAGWTLFGKLANTSIAKQLNSTRYARTQSSGWIAAALAVLHCSTAPSERTASWLTHWMNYGLNSPQASLLLLVTDDIHDLVKTPLV
jgi:hypothetical protein